MALATMLALVDGDDVVGAPITDEAGVEAALLPGGAVAPCSCAIWSRR